MVSSWRVASGFTNYEVSECGRVRRLTRGGRRYPVGYELTPRRHVKGYLVYSLVGPDGLPKDILAHRLVALTWLGEPPTTVHEVAHYDGSRTNNHYSNLRWATPSENQADRQRHGTYVSGDNASSARLTDGEVSTIREVYAANGVRFVGGAVTMQDLANRYRVSVAQVSRIVNRMQRVAHGAV